MTSPSNTPNGPTVSQAWADNMPLDTLNQVLQTSTTTTVAQQLSTDSQRFWATPTRPASDTTSEVLQITLTSARLVNQVIFDAAIFPHSIALEYFDEEAKAWSPCLVGDASSPVPISDTILDSYPLVLPLVTTVSGHLHPQHSFSGHWRTVEFDVRPVVARLFRLLLQRTTRGTAPLSVFGAPVDYSLAVRNFYVGYQVASLDDLPVSSPFTDAVTVDGTFASTTDFLGSAINFSVHTDSATNVLLNQGSPTSGAIWKSEPQPFPWAVVNFYVDARDDDGLPQVIDRFYVEPLYDGPSCHLYYSNDDVTTSYPGSLEPLPPSIAVIHNPNGIIGDILHSGLAGLNAIAFVDINNSVLSFDPGHTWWVGASLNFKFPHGTEIIDTPILDCGAFTIALTPLGIRCTTTFGDTLAINVGAFDPATPMVFIARYDGTHLSLDVQVGQVRYNGSRMLAVPLSEATVTTIRVGAFQQPSPGLGNFDLNAFVLKTDDVPDATTITDFLLDPDPYVVIQNFRMQADPRTNNALLRYHEGWSTSDFPAGFIGGEPNHYAELSWSPIARDYVLRKGYLDFPSTKAKYWKLEFTSLVPESYEVFKPISQLVKTFPMSMWNLAEFSLKPSNSTTTKPLNTSIYQVNNSVTAAFDTFNVSSRTGTGAAALGLSPTQARVIWDYTSRQNLAGAYWAWNFLPLHNSHQIPSFTSEGIHTYEQVTVTQTTKLAYFVGLISIVAYRLDALAVEDSPRYVDNFFDMTSISSDTNWVLLGDHQLTSGSTSYAVLQSQPLPSSRVVLGVQFAAQQSDPTQLLPDSEFDDPTHSNWTAVGDGVLAPGIVTDITVGNTLQISRATAAMSWNLLASAYPLWHNITDLNLTFDELGTAFQNPQLSGGVSSGPIATPAGGRISVAARVIAPADLSHPLWVQVVDNATTTVLSEEPMTVKAHQVTEWFTSYSIGDVPIPPWLWEDFTPLLTHMLLVDSFQQPNNAILPPMDSGQLWSYTRDSSGNPLSLSLVSHKAVVTTQGQSNYVDVNAIWGTLEFTLGAMGSVAASNLLPNPSFETNLTGWNSLNAATLAQTSGGSPTGGSFYCLVTATQNTSHSGIDFNILGGVVPNTPYRFSADINSSSVTTVNLNLAWYNSTGGLLSVTNVPLTVTTGTWQHLETVQMSPTGATQVIGYIDGNIMPINSTLGVDNVYFGVYAGANLILNPSFETNANSWGTVSGTLTRVAGGSPTGGSWSGQMKSTSGSADTALITSSKIGAIQAGSAYFLSSDIMSSLGAHGFQLVVNWYNSSNMLISTTTSGLVSSPATPSTWYTISSVHIAPAGAVSATIEVDGQTMAVNATFNADNLNFTLYTELMLAFFDPFFIDDGGTLNEISGSAYDVVSTNVLTTSGAVRAVQANDDIRVDIMPTYLVPGNRQDISRSANPDPVVWSYSLLFYLNGTWVRTISHDRGARSIMGIKGRLNQQFGNWSWTPFGYGNLLGRVIMYYPRLDQGAWQDTQTLNSFLDGDGNVWHASGSWDLSTAPEITNADNCGAPLTAASNGAQFVVDTGIWYGAMTAYVRNVASGQTGTKHGYVFCLDADNGVFLDYAGNVVSNGATYGTLVPGGIPNNCMLTVQWVQSARVSATTRGTVNPVTYPDMLVAKISGSIVGTFASIMLQTWRGTKRGLCGDIYNPGTGARPTAPNYTLDTSFRSFNWAPDASLVPQNPTSVSWNQVTDYNTLTYDQATHGQELGTPSLRAQLVQYGESQDVWDVDNLSLFVDPLVWSFSNDGGSTFYPAYDIRNDPFGVLSFPPSTVVTSLGRKPGTALVWKVTSYAPDRMVSSLVVRPWYAGLLSGTTRKVGIGTTGPTLMPYDHVPPIENDPSFQVWSSPIPQSWWYQFRQVQRAITGQQQVNPGVVMFPGEDQFPGDTLFPG